MTTDCLLCRLLCFFGKHKFDRYIKSEDYTPPQIMVAGCYVCSRCQVEKWV